MLSNDCQVSEVVDMCTGVITTLERLDREAVSRHELTLMVRDRGTPLPKRSYARVVINVVDVNDHAPEFLASQYEARVYCMSVPGTSVAQLTALDRDHAHNAVVTYSIISGQYSFTIYVIKCYVREGFHVSLSFSVL